jgi:hypothetical protein
MTSDAHNVIDPMVAETRKIVKTFANLLILSDVLFFSGVREDY